MIHEKGVGQPASFLFVRVHRRPGEGEAVLSPRFGGLAGALLGRSVLALEYALRYAGRVSQMILMNPAPASEADYKQLRNDWLEKRAADMERRKAIAATAAYQEGDPDAVTAYYRIHFKPALARSADYEKLITRSKRALSNREKGASSRRGRLRAGS
jgi:pimeloyl-ACP methyl ester carboxylesterase